MLCLSHAANRVANVDWQAPDGAVRTACAGLACSVSRLAPSARPHARRDSCSTLCLPSSGSAPLLLTHSDRSRACWLAAALASFLLCSQARHERCTAGCLTLGLSSSLWLQPGSWLWHVVSTGRAHVPKAAGRRCRMAPPHTHCTAIPAGGIPTDPDVLFAKSKITWPVAGKTSWSLYLLAKDGGKGREGLPRVAIWLHAWLPGQNTSAGASEAGSLLSCSMGAPLLLSAWLCLLAAWGAAGAERSNPPIVIVPGKLVLSSWTTFIKDELKYQVTASPQLYKHFCTETFVLSTFITFAGLAGSVLEERLNRTNTPHWYCATEVDDWQTVWLSLQSASRPDCLLDELQVFYDDSTGRCAAQCCTVSIPRKLVLPFAAFCSFFFGNLCYAQRQTMTSSGTAAV